MSLISRRGVVAFFTLVITSFFESAIGASGPSVVCRKVGQTTIFRGKKYTCIKSGKKLVWDKGVLLPKPTPTQSNTAPTQSPTSKPPQIFSPVVMTLGDSNEVKMGETVFYKGKDAYGRPKEYSITRTENGLIALDTVCTHEGCSVIFEKKKLVCPCHLSYFDAITGKAETGPANLPLKKYPVKEVDGKIILTD